MTSAIVASVGGAVVSGMISSSGSSSAAAAAAAKDTAATTQGYENQSGVDQISSTLKSLGYTDEQINELTQSMQQQSSQQDTSQTGQSSTSQTGSTAGTTSQNQAQTGQTSTAEQLANNLAASGTTSQTQGSVLNQFQAGNTNPAQQLFDATAGGISPEQYQAIVAKAGMDLDGQVPGLNKSLATAAGTSTANNSGLAIGLEQAKQNAMLTAAAQSVAASQGNQQIAAGAAGTIAGATTGNNQTLEQWLQQGTTANTQQQTQQTTGSQTSANNTATTGANNQTTSDLTNQLSNQTGSTTGSNTTTGTTSTNKSDQTASQSTAQQDQTTTSTGTSQYGESSATDVDSLTPPKIGAPSPTDVTAPAAPNMGAVVGPTAPGGAVNVPVIGNQPQPGLQFGNGYGMDGIPQDPTTQTGFAQGGLITQGSALPGHAPSRGTANANGAPGSAAVAQIMIQEANRKSKAVTDAAGILSKYFATPVVDKDGKMIKNADGTPIYPIQNITDALKSSTGVGDFFTRVSASPTSTTPAGTTVGQPALASSDPFSFSSLFSTDNVAGDNIPGNSGAGLGMGSGVGDGLDFSSGDYSFGGDGFSDGGQISGPGTGTSDSIPAVVGGKKPIAVSNGEYVIPADVVDTLTPGFFDNLLANYHNRTGQ